MTLDLNRVTEDAHTIAAFLNGLTERGIPIGSAVQLAAAYIATLTTNRIADSVLREQKPPKEPWE